MAAEEPRFATGGSFAGVDRLAVLRGGEQVIALQPQEEGDDGPTTA